MPKKASLRQENSQLLSRERFEKLKNYYLVASVFALEKI